MDPRRGLARGLGPVLVVVVVVVVIAALVGVFEGEGFVEGDSGKVDEVEKEKEGGTWWEEVEGKANVGVMLMLGVWSGVVGLGMLRVMRQQKRLEERQERLDRGEKRHRALEAVLRFYGKVHKPTKPGDVLELIVEGLGRGLLFADKERAWLAEFGKKAAVLEQIDGKLMRGEYAAVERKCAEQKRTDIVKWMLEQWEGLQGMVAACWGEE